MIGEGIVQVRKGLIVVQELQRGVVKEEGDKRGGTVYKAAAILVPPLSQVPLTWKSWVMSSQIEMALARLRAAAVSEGPQWLDAAVQSLLPRLPEGAADAGPRRAVRRARPPERLSPEITPRSRRCRRSPKRDPPALGRGARRVPGTGPRGIRTGSRDLWMEGLPAGVRPLLSSHGERW